jgi:hypothetical protein
MALLTIISELCVLCENADHLLFRCPLATFFVWSFISETLGWKDYSRSRDDLLSNWLPRKFGVSYQTGRSCFAGIAFAWAIWTARKKCALRFFPNKAIDIVHLGVSYLQKWKIPTRSLERLKLVESLQQGGYL